MAWRFEDVLPWAAAAAVGLAIYGRVSGAQAAYVPSQGGGFAEVQRLAGEVEARAQMPGFAALALGVSQRESRGYNLAANTSESEAAAACRGFNKNTRRYGNSPYPATRWCFGSGGYYGQLPSTALAAPGFEMSDPWIVFDPLASTVMLADFVRRVVRGHFHKLPAKHRNFLTLRRFMASNTVGLDWAETLDRSRRVRERFAGDLAKRGIDPSFMFEPVTIGAWPGAVPLYRAMGGGAGNT